MSTLVGMQLSGRYRLDALVGTGGMATVYRAFDQVLERQVAIKLLHREMGADSDQLERFRREARAVAQLSHPHVVGVIDAGEDDERPYIVFEFVEGDTLKDRIRRFGRLPVGEAVAYAIEIARALGAAHARGIVHRDVKPQNVLIDEEGSAKVTDFGIARTLEEDGLTADGRVLGTTDYVSPEQALGHVVTGQSDLYSLGVVLFEMLTGDVPFHGETQVSVAMKHVREELPDVQVLRPEVSSALGSVLDHVTAKALEHRYPDAATLIGDLEDVLAIEAARAGRTTGEATAVLRTLPRSTRRRLPLRMRVPAFAVVGALCLGLIAVGAVLILGADRAERGTGQGRVVVPVPAGEEGISLGQSRADDYDPFGDDSEHPKTTTAVLDRDPTTAWDTESYEGGVLAGKAGVGLSIDAKPGTTATRMQVQTPKPGWTAEVYAADSPQRPECAADPCRAMADIEGWTKVGERNVTSKRADIALETGDTEYRWYLLLITSLPEGDKTVEISEIRLFRRAG